MPDPSDLWTRYDNIMKKINPNSSSKAAFASRGTSRSTITASVANSPVSSATIVSWSAAASNDALRMGKIAEAKQLEELKQEAMEKTTPEDVNNEISAFYSMAFDLRNAEMTLESIANISETTISKESRQVIESYLDRVSLITTGVVSRLRGVVTDSLNELKERLSGLKDLLKQGVKKAKGEIIDAFNKVMDYFFGIISDFVSRMFSFVSSINELAKKKGYTLKSLDISFDPPSFGKVTILGVPVPFPKFSLPKMDVNFEPK